MSKKALVKNAASESQVKDGKETAKLIEERESEDLRYILETPQGRRFVWRAMGYCGLYKSPYAHSGSEQNVNIGRSEVARWLLSEIIKIDEVYWLEMQKENLKQGDINV